MNKEEVVTTILPTQNRSIGNKNVGIKRTRNKKRQFKNPSSSLFGTRIKNI